MHSPLVIRELHLGSLQVQIGCICRAYSASSLLLFHVAMQLVGLVWAQQIASSKRLVKAATILCLWAYLQDSPSTRRSSCCSCAAHCSSSDGHSLPGRCRWHQLF